MTVLNRIAGTVLLMQQAKYAKGRDSYSVLKRCACPRLFLKLAKTISSVMEKVLYAKISISFS
jgi:hypothetical protein